MSYDQWLYKAHPSVGSIKHWEEDHSVPIGSMAEIKRLFSEALGYPLIWEDNGNCSWSYGCGTSHGFEIVISKTDNMVTLKGCSKKQAIRLAKKLDLSAYDPQYGEQLIL